jgi:excisionase family DNA binding protein
MSKELTVKEYAERERVHEQTVRTWIRKGAVPVRRTPGGGIRIREAQAENRQSVVVLNRRQT